MSGFQPDHASAGVCPSPNHGARRNGRTPDMLILHYTGMPSAEAALAWLCAEESQVSSHYFVDERGRITQLVPESQRAWHAGQGHWKGDTDINSASIGIEIANPGHAGGSPPFEAAQNRELVIRLCAGYRRSGAIFAERCARHRTSRRCESRFPGELFPWDRSSGSASVTGVERGRWRVAVLPWRAIAWQTVEALQSMLTLYGLLACCARGRLGYDAEDKLRMTGRSTHFWRQGSMGWSASTIGTTAPNFCSEIPTVS